MTTSNLESKIQALTQAAADFQVACDEYYLEQRRRPKHFGDFPPQPQAQLNLQEKIRQITALGTYSNVQARAIQGAFLGWRPPQPKRPLSLPFENRVGGAR